MEFWKTGSEKRKKPYSTKNVESTFFDDAHQASIFCFLPHKILHQNKKINAIICALSSVFFKPIIPLFQHSIIPIVSEANRTHICLSVGFHGLPIYLKNFIFVCPGKFLVECISRIANDV